MQGAEQLTRAVTIPVARALSRQGDFSSVTSAAEQQIGTAFQTTTRVGDEAQRKTVDLMFDLLTLKPLIESFQDNTKICDNPGEGYQSSPELDYLNALLEAGPASSSTILIVMAMLYSNLNRQVEGIGRFEYYLNRYSSQLLPSEKSVYLSCLALLRAGRAQQLSLLQLTTQLDLIRRTLSDMNEAKELTRNEPDFTPNLEKLIARWVSGLLQTGLPWPFGNRQAALEDLRWCEKTITESIERKSAAFQFLREVYYNLAVIYKDAGQNDLAQQYLALSRHESFDKKILLATFYATDSFGLKISIKHITESIPGKVFTVSGFDMSEFNFIISDDGTQMMAVDMGSREDTAEGAYKFFEEYYTQKYGGGPGFSGLPKLTKVFVSHVHWDHIGGHKFFEQLNPNVEFYSRYNYLEEKEMVKHQPPPFKWYLGVTFSSENVTSYEPAKLVKDDTELMVGGTRVQLILPPYGGGETPDGMLIHLPDHRVLYGGDFIVPWVGTPYTVEGNIDSLLDTMDMIANLDPPPAHILYGHEALTKFVGTVEILMKLRPHLKWLRDETLKHIYAYKNRAEIQQMNLFPPDILKPSEAVVQLPYLIWRETFIDRVYVQTVGYWGPQLQGVDYLTAENIGAAFSHYLKLSEEDLSVAIERMILGGDHELAGQVADWAISQYPNSGRLRQVKQEAFLKLKEKWQLIIPFKFVMYSEHIDNPTPQIR
jgi:glyoxylase-like metal-dependent hydrolase (beta-lactamase superfamily II)